MEKEYLKEVGERLFTARTNNLFSRKELAKLADVPIETVKNMERGEQSVGIYEATKICKALNCSMEYILTGNCGLQELITTNKKFFELSGANPEKIQKIAQAFWNTCPR